MSSSLLRLTKSFRPPLAMAYRLLPSSSHCNRQHSRSFCSPPDPNFTFDLPFLGAHMKLMAGVPSMLISVVNTEEITVNIPGMSKTETDNGPCVSINIPGLSTPTGEGETIAYNQNVVDNNLLIHLETDTAKHVYLAAIKLPHNLDLNGNYKVLISKGVFNVTIPVLKNSDYIMPDLVEATVKLPRRRTTEMFHRSALGKVLCQVMARPEVKSKSFTGYKKDTGESICIKGNMPGLEKIVVNGEGLCVSLSMPGLEIEDVELGFEYETLIIEGKRGNEHYIAGILVPEGFHTETHMIKREMQDGTFKATLPHDEGGENKTNKRAFSVYRAS